MTRNVKVRRTGAPSLKVENGEVVKVASENVEIVDETTEENGKILHRIQTPEGEAVYEYLGDCFDCANEGVTTPVFHCTTKVRADEEIGVQLAAGWNDGGSATRLCQRHYAIRRGTLSPHTEAQYKVIEKRW